MNDEKYIFEVTTEDFAEKVIASSHERVVLVDFWAEWCAPCKMLAPVLERIVQSLGGRVVLAKVNTDENQDLAHEFGIQSIPSVKIFHRGAVAEEFVGVLPEHEITALITSIAGDEIEDRILQAAGLFGEGRLDEAETLLLSVLAEKPKYAGALIGLARIAIEQHDTTQARELLGSIGEGDKPYDDARVLLARIEFEEICVKAGGLDACQTRYAEEPDNLDVLYNLGCCFVVNSRYREAFDVFFTIMGKSMDYRSGAARKAVLSLFNIVGQTSDITAEYRGKLATLLF